jgi:hypothetical protein
MTTAYRVQASKNVQMLLIAIQHFAIHVASGIDTVVFRIVAKHNSFPCALIAFGKHVMQKAALQPQTSA